ncbi:MAG: universal stress protein [Cyanobacteria bacterium P01_C01_bin.72]
MINKIIVAVDQSPLGKPVFDTALSLAKTTGANLMLLHVMSPKESEYPITPLNTYYPLVEGIDYEQYHQLFAEYEQRGLKLLQNLTEEATKAEIAAEFTQLSGNPGRMICELATNWSADLIVVGSRGLQGLKEMFLGSVSNYVTHHAPCSVLIFRNSVDQNLEQNLSESDENSNSQPLATNH